MDKTKLTTIEKIPPFRIHSSLFQTNYVINEPPFVVSQKIAGLDMMAAEGVVGVCITMGQSVAQVDSDINPTIKELIELCRKLAITNHRAVSRIRRSEGHPPTPVTSLVCMNTLWDDGRRIFFFDIQDLSIDDLNDDIPRF